MSKTLQNGSFQDAVGTVVNGGTIEFVLSHDAMIIAGGQVAPTRVSATLDATGDMPAAFTILANDELTPSGTFYLTTVFDSNGARVFGPERWVFSGSSPIDLDAMTPTIVDPAFADPILSNPVANQSIDAFDLDVLDLNSIRKADQFSGANAGAKIITAIADLPSTGGVVDARGFEGAQTIAANMFAGVTKDVTLRLGHAVFTISVAQSHTPGSNKSFRILGQGLSTVFKPSTAMTVLTVDMSSSNYQSLHLADLAFDLNATNSTALSFISTGQKGIAERIYIDNNLSSATANVIIVDNTSHTMRLEDIRIRGASATADGISVSSNAVILNGLDITGCQAAVIIPAGSAINALSLTASRLDSNVNGFQIDGVGALSTTIAHNHFESNTGSAIDIAGFDATTNRVFGLTVRDNYFTGMDGSAQDGITLFRANGVVIERNHFMGVGSVAEGVTFTASVTDVSLKGNTVNGVLAGMTNFSGVVLPISDVRLTQTSSDGGFGGVLTAILVNPLEGSLSNTPRWIYKQVDHTDMTAGATADTFTLWTLPANTMIHDVVATVVTAWAGTGPVSAAVASVGTTGGPNDLALDDNFFATGTRYDLHDATANGGKGALLFNATDKFAPHFYVAGGDIELQMDLTGGNHSATTAGQARIYILVSQPLGNTTTEAN